MGLHNRVPPTVVSKLTVLVLLKWADSDLMNNEMAEYGSAFLFFAAVGLISFGVWRFVSALRTHDPVVRAETRRKARIAMVWSVGMVAILAVAAKAYMEVDLRIGDAGRYATRQGRTIQLHPSNVTFQVPQSWLEWDSEFHNNFHLTHRQLRSVRVGHGEWDSEYASVVNTSLPFEDCAAHVGGEGWGWQGVSFADLQVRTYVTNLSQVEVVARIKSQGFETAQRIAERQSGLEAGGKALLSASTEQRWQHIKISYPLWYGDYGGTAPVDFYVRDTDRFRLVMVLMGWGAEGEATSILSSVAIPGE
jgi:hypothetical protein